jgi:hypothetical protein
LGAKHKPFNVAVGVALSERDHAALS